MTRLLGDGSRHVVIVPAALLARMLGIHIAVAWQHASAGDWANYAADVSRRPRIGSPT